MEKKYFFTDKTPILENNRKYYASGVVEKIFTEINTPQTSGKDLVVNYIEPFTGRAFMEWRSLNEVELYVCETENEEFEYELAKEAIELVSNKFFGEKIPGEKFGTPSFTKKLNKIIKARAGKGKSYGIKNNQQ